MSSPTTGSSKEPQGSERRRPGPQVLIPALPALLISSVVSAGSWHVPSRTCRVQVDLAANGHVRYEKPAEASINFTSLLSSLGKSGSFDIDSVRVVEVDGSGGLVDADVPFQFDEDSDFNPSSKASGTLVFMMGGTTASGATRRFQVYFDLGSFSPPSITPLISYQDDVPDEGQNSYKINCQNATYWYHKLGAGFSSMEDLNGNDWISYQPGGGSAGEYRGIPNMGYPEGYCHPGKTVSSSQILHSGPVKITFRSDSNDGQWAVMWEMYPTYGKLTVLKISHAHWFLYEGTPGGSLDVSGTASASDFCVRPGNVVNMMNSDWGGDLSGPEWVYFGDKPSGGLNRVLFLIHHENDAHEDSFYEMNQDMTVFGFGRVLHSTTRLMTAVPGHFTIGFCESTNYSTVSAHIDSAYQPLSVSLGTPESISATTTRTTVDCEIRDHKGGSATSTDVQNVISDYRQGN